MTTTTTTTITSVTKKTITRKQLIEAFNLPENAEIYFSVPGGGDYSNMDLDLDERTGITVRYEETKPLKTE